MHAIARLKAAKGVRDGDDAWSSGCAAWNVMARSTDVRPAGQGRAGESPNGTLSRKWQSTKQFVGVEVCAQALSVRSECYSRESSGPATCGDGLRWHAGTLRANLAGCCVMASGLATFACLLDECAAVFVVMQTAISSAGCSMFKERGCSGMRRAQRFGGTSGLCARLAAAS